MKWSRGRNRFDAQPVQREGSMREFAEDVLAHRAQSKATSGYVSGPFGGDGRRCAKNALQRDWIALDVDGIDPAALVPWRLHAARWRGFGWPTASSTERAPRERIVIELSEPVDREQGIRIGALLVSDIDAEFGTAVRIDPCGFRADQPAFLPLVGIKPFYLLGDPLDVPAWLAQAPAAPPPPPPAEGVVVAMADAKMRVVIEMLGDCGLLRAPLPNHKGYALTCPWTQSHTSETSPTATVLLFPSEDNAWRGGFRCLHAHCAGRSLRDLTDLLALAVKKGVLCQ